MDIRTVLFIVLSIAVKHTISFNLSVKPKEGITQMNSGLAFVAHIEDLPKGQAKYLQITWHRNYATHSQIIWTGMYTQLFENGKPTKVEVMNIPKDNYEDRLKGGPARNILADLTKTHTLMFLDAQPFDEGKYHVEFKYQHDETVTVGRSEDVSLVVYVPPQPRIVFFQNGEKLETAATYTGANLDVQCRSHSAKSDRSNSFDLTLYQGNKELKACSPRTEEDSCEAGWTMYRGSCYLTMEEKADFKTAQSTCNRKKASLVSIADKKENVFIKHLSIVNNIERGWLGMRKKNKGCSNALLECNRAQWEWEDGTKYESRVWYDWRTGEPQHDELCAVLSHQSWVGTDCQRAYHYFCERVQCKKGWIYRENSCYLPVRKPETFPVATSKCKEHGATLVTISDKEENVFVKILQQNHNLEEVWMGMNKLVDECDTLTAAASLECRRSGWQWVDGTVYDPIGYSDWESDDEPIGTDVCIKMTDTTQSWKGADCGAKYDYICEKSTCDPGWDLYNGRCYYFGGADKKIPYQKADKVCEGLDATLMTIGDEHESRFMKTHMTTHGADFAWMGLTKEKNTCAKNDSDCRIHGWQWDDGTVYDSKKWNDWSATAEPQKEDVCVSMVLAHNGWDGNKPDDCIQKQKYICEKEGNDHICASTVVAEKSLHGVAFWCQAKWQGQNYDSSKVILATNGSRGANARMRSSGGRAGRGGGISSGGTAAVVTILVIVMSVGLVLGTLVHYRKLNKEGMIGLRDQALEHGRKAVTEVRSRIDKIRTKKEEEGGEPNEISDGETAM